LGFVPHPNLQELALPNATPYGPIEESALLRAKQPNERSKGDLALDLVLDRDLLLILLLLLLWTFCPSEAAAVR
jgi:hypothetical protein